jgi:nucleoid DNA-binding protein
MKKEELVKLLAAAMGITKIEANKRINDMDAIVEVLAKELAVGAKSKIGKYIVVEKKEIPEKVCRNPKTGEEITVDKHIAVKVKHSAAIKNI